MDNWILFFCAHSRVPFTWYLISKDQKKTCILTNNISIITAIYDVLKANLSNTVSIIIIHTVTQKQQQTHI